jgi:hypothetical protein
VLIRQNKRKKIVRERTKEARHSPPSFLLRRLYSGLLSHENRLNNGGAHCYKNYYTKTVNKSGDNSFVFNPIPAIISAASPRETIPATTESKPFQENLANFASNAAPASFVNTAKHLMHYYPNMPEYAKKFDGSHDKKIDKNKR